MRTIDGALDLLIKDLEDGANGGLIVADLKTGKPPEDELSEKVSRQLLFYRDIMKENVTEDQDLRAEGGTLPTIQFTERRTANLGRSHRGMGDDETD